MERQFLHCFSKNFGKLECSMFLLWSSSVTPPSSWGPLPSVGSWSCQCFLRMLAAGWSCPPQMVYQEETGGNEAPWDDSCSQTQIQRHLIAVSWRYNFRAESPVVPLRKSPDSAQMISCPKEDAVCPDWACLLLQLHELPFQTADQTAG